jgi:signal transduction histidine kinase
VRFEGAALLLTLLGMVAYEAVEIWVLEAPRRSPLLPVALLHSLQVIVVLAAVRMILRAWRQKTDHEEALARMVEKVIFAQEEERRRIAYELHDGISPLIVSAKQHLDTCRDLWALEPGRAEGQLATGAERLGAAIMEMRRVLSALRPSAIMTSGGLGQAAQQSVEEAAREAGWKVAFHEELGDERLPPTVEAAAFRILQEALANIRKHAGSERVDVELRRDQTWLHLEVRDHGVGFLPDSAPVHRGLGLFSMQERAQLVGGTCSIESAEPRGTCVRVRLPLATGA